MCVSNKFGVIDEQRLWEFNTGRETNASGNQSNLSMVRNQEGA